MSQYVFDVRPAVMVGVACLGGGSWDCSQAPACKLLKRCQGVDAGVVYCEMQARQTSGSPMISDETCKGWPPT